MNKQQAVLGALSVFALLSLQACATAPSSGVADAKEVKEAYEPPEARVGSNILKRSNAIVIKGEEAGDLVNSMRDNAVKSGGKGG